MPYGVFPNEVSETIRVRRIPIIMSAYNDRVGIDKGECGGGPDQRIQRTGGRTGNGFRREAFIWLKLEGEGRRQSVLYRMAARRPGQDVQMRLNCDQTKGVLQVGNQGIGSRHLQ